MALLLHKAMFPLLVWLIASASCYQPTSKHEVISHPPRHLFRIRERGAQKPVPGRLLAWQKGKVYPFAVGERGDPGQEIQRVRRSWLADYMDDLWTHIHGSFPRAALYAFPLALGIMLLLCCITICGGRALDALLWRSPALGPMSSLALFHSGGVTGGPRRGPGPSSERFMVLVT
ncbi:small integral membrane protein 9 [Chelydra serpentina]|uniref:Small integral membrane protein 9 n=1 Tax=Chelydra serpentina TaxID=8475 RepID=A0A8T1S6E4_CHESE|nr:small integral membrane protein 9 [Chelydra serpentina]